MASEAMIVERVASKPGRRQETAMSLASTRRLTNPRAIAARLVSWAEEAKFAGRVHRSECLLLKAWEAYELVTDGD
jgi:hypothetical protein